MSMGAASAQTGRRDASHCSGCFTISAYSGHSRWFSTVLRRLSVTTFRRRHWGAMSANTGKQVPVISEWATCTSDQLHCCKVDCR